MITMDINKSIIVYNPKTFHRKEVLRSFFNKLSTSCEKTFQKHKKSLCLFFAIFFICTYLSVCYVFLNHSVPCICHNYIDFFGVVVHVMWITIVFLTGFTVYGRIISVCSNVLVAFNIGGIWGDIFYSVSESILYSICMALVVLTYSFLSVLFHAFVFSYSKRAFDGYARLFNRRPLVYHSLFSVIFLFFTFLIELLIFN